MRAAILSAIARRDFELERSYRLAIVYDLVLGAVNLVLYFFISRIVEPDPEELAGAPSYFAFAVAGILMSLIVETAAAEISSRIRDEQLTGTLELLLAQPVRTSELAVGQAAFPLSFAVVRVALYLTIAALALDLEVGQTDWLGLALMLLASGLAFAPLGILAAGVTIVFKRGASIAELALFAMTFLGGALFPVAVLPPVLQAIGSVMPTRFAFDGTRSALFGEGAWWDDALVLAGMAAVLLPLSVWVFAVALRRARRDGSLAEY